MAANLIVNRTTTFFNDQDEVGTFDPGDVLYTRVTITNNGDANATNVTFEDTFAGTTLVAGTLNVSPIAFNDSFTAVANTVLRVGGAATIGSAESISVGGNLLSNDRGSSTLGTGVIVGDSVPGFQIDTVTSGVSAKGGTFNIFSDGSFNYVNDGNDTEADLTGGDTFTYTIRDAGLDNTYNTADDLLSTATVTITFSTQSGAPGTAVNRVWYVDGTSGSDATGDGTSAKPFATTTALNGAGGAGDVDAAGHFIYVKHTVSGSIQLEASQKLIGTGEELVVGGFAITADGGLNSTLNASSGFAVTLSTNNTVAGINLGGTGGITGTSFGTLTVTDDVVLTTGGQALSLTTGAFAGTGFASTTSLGGVNNVALTGVTGTVNLGSGALSGATGTTATGGNLMINGGTATVNYSGDISQGTAGVQLVNVNGGHQTGTVTLTGTLSATGGAGLVFNDADGTYNIAHNGTSSVGSATLNNVNNGVSITNGSAGTFNFGTGVALQTATGTTFTVDGGNGNINFHGTITDDQGQLVRIVNRGGGTIDFNGLITDGFDGDGGINQTEGSIHLGANTGGTVRFDGGINLSTGANDAFTSSGNVGSTLVITDPSGATANRIQTTTGTALDVQNTMIGSGGLVFESIASNGAVNGIVLNNTGSTAGLTVTGTGSAGTGGTINASTGVGILLTSTNHVVLDRMIVQNGGEDGIRATTVNNFTLRNSTVLNNGNADEEHGIDLLNVTGTLLVDAVTVRGSFEHNFKLNNTAGTLDTLNIKNSTFDHLAVQSGAAGGNGVLIVTNNSAVITDASISNSVFRNNFSNGILVNVENSSRIGADNATSGSTDGFVVSGNTFDDNNIAIQFGVFHTSDLTVDIQANTIVNDNRTANVAVGGTSTAIVVGSSAIAGAGSTLNARIDGNIIGNAAIPGSGSSVGSGIRVIVQGLTDGTILINNNTIRQAPNGYGIEATFLGPSTVADEAQTVPTSDITVTNNNVNHVHESFKPGTSDFPLPAIYIAGDNQGTPAGAPPVRADVRGNTVPTALPSAGFVSGFTNNWLEVYEYTGTNPGNIVVVDTGAASPSADQQLKDTNTGRVGANAEVGLTTATITTPPDLSPLPMMAEAPPAGDDEPADGGLVQDPQVDNGDGGSHGNHQYGDPVPADDGDSGPVVVDDGVLSEAELALIVEAAIQRWIAAGATDEQVAAMRAVKISVTDHGGLLLAESGAGTITLDTDAAGWRWFVDSTPDDDSEYTGSGTRLAATDSTGHAGTRIDLLTVIMHELGHQIGLADVYAPGETDELMYGTIGAGQRRLPGDDDLHYAQDGPVAGSFAFAPMNLGTLEPGRTVTIEWRHTIDQPSEDGVVGSWTGQSIVDSDQTDPVLSSAQSGNVDSLTLGNLVFLDVNKNGLFDAGDSGIAGVVLTLYADTNNNGVYDDGVDLYVGYNEVNGTPGYQQGQDTPASPGTGTPLTATTDANGVYAFSALAPGDYIVRVNATNFNSGQPLNSRVASPTATDPDTDADDNDNNVETVGGFTYTRAIRLDYGQEPTAGTGNDTNNTLDMAFEQPNQPPAIANLDGNNVAYTEGDDWTQVELGGNVDITDADSPDGDFGGGSLTITVAGSQAGDERRFNSSVEIDPGTGNTTVDGAVIAIATELANGWSFALLDAATADRIEMLMKALEYRSTSEHAPGVRTFSWTLVDGDGRDNGGDDDVTVTSTVTVAATNDAPVVPNSPAVNATEQTPVTLNSSLTISDVELDARNGGAGDYGGASFIINRNGGSPDDFFSFDTTGASFTVVGNTLQSGGQTFATFTMDTTSGILNVSFTSSGTVATTALVNDVVRHLQYTNLSDNPPASVQLIYGLDDGAPGAGQGTVVNNNNFDGGLVTVNIAAVNDAPSIDLNGAAGGVDNNAAYTEQAVAAALAPNLVLADPDDTNIESATVSIGTGFIAGADSLTIGALTSGTTGTGGAIAFSYDGTTGVMTLTGAASVADYQTALRQVSFSSTSDHPGASRTISWKANDGDLDSALPATTLTITELNDPPVVDLNGSDPGIDYTAAFGEGGAGVAIGSNISVSDPDEGSGDQIESVTITITDPVTDDVLALAGALPSGITVDPSSTATTMKLVGSASAADYQAALALVRYSSSSEDPSVAGSDAARTITVVVNDGTVNSATATATVNITAENDAPVNTVPGAQNGTEDTDLVFSTGNGNAISVFDRDVGGGDMTVTLSVGNGRLTLATVAGLTSVSGNGTGSVSLTGSMAEINAALDGLVYRGNLNADGADTLTIVTSDNGLSGTGGTLTDTDQVAITLADDGIIHGDSGNNDLDGTAQRDIFHVQQGGNDDVSGLGGNDTFYFGGAFTAADTVDGGEGIDSIILQGNYAVTFGTGTTSNISGIETISLAPGHFTDFGDTANNFYDYNLTMLDANVAPGALLKVNGFYLRAGEDLTFDGSAELDGRFIILAGLGVDNLTGGSGNDVFVFGHDGRFGASDVVHGGPGYDSLYLRGDYALDFTAPGAGTITGMESIFLASAADLQFASGGDGEFDYSIVWDDAMLATGAIVTINGSTLGANETMAFDGSDEQGGRFRLFGGAAADTLTGGGGGDFIYGGGGGDTLKGNGGSDHFRYYDVSDSTPGAGNFDTVLDFAHNADLFDLTVIDADSTLEGDQAFTFIGSAAFSGAGQLRAELIDAGTNKWKVEGDIDGNGGADFYIEVVVQAGQPLTAADFFL